MICEQASTLITCYSIMYNDKRAQLLKRLVDVSPAHYEKVFLCNSGTESVEAAIKAARTTTGKTEIISLMRGFHGKSLGSLSATWDKNYQELFMPLVPGFTHVPANKLDKLEAALTDDMAAVIMEVVQGEGGVPMGAILCRSSINLP